MQIHSEEGPPGSDCSRIEQLNMSSSSPHLSRMVTSCMTVARSYFLSEQDSALSPAQYWILHDTVENVSSASKLEIRYRHIIYSMKQTVQDSLPSLIRSTNVETGDSECLNMYAFSFEGALHSEST